MPERDGYIPGVPCWIDTTQPDPEAAARFYGELFGWELENAMPPGSAGQYFIGRIRGGDVAAVGSIPDGRPAAPAWHTYIWVESADETTSKVRAAGGEVVAEPFDVPGAGRTAVCADPAGAEFCVWEAKEHKGARVVNEHGSVNFNDLYTNDIEGARAFYGAIFGWRVLDLDGGRAWALPGYGDHLERANPGLRDQMKDVGAPKGFEDVVASLGPLGDGAGLRPHWGVTFAVDDADAIARRASELGASVVAPPFDAPWVRMTVIADPKGATFTASQFVPGNR